MPPLDEGRVSPRGMARPEPRGPLSATLTRCLPRRGAELPADPPIEATDALLDDDLQLALFLCHELHYGGLEGVPDSWEWEPSFVAFRSLLERAMLARLIEEVGPPEPLAPESVPEAIFALVAGDGTPPLSRYLEARASREQFREFVVHRSAYQLKEADPHTFAIPRIAGPPKAAMVEVQADEYGGGDAERMHSALFAQTM